MRSEKNPSLIYPIEGDISFGDLADDGHQLRPAIVWFEEPVPMIERAIEITESADIYLVVGTSLLVYPAAGLLHYVAPAVPVFIIDKKIMYYERDVTSIEKPATEGIRDFINLAKTLV